MSAPERIYLDGDAEAGDGYFTRCFETAKPCSEPAIEYIRADLCTPTDERVKALDAENARLRIALQQIVGGEIYTAADGFSKPHEPEQSRIARAALRDMDATP